MRKALIALLLGSSLGWCAGAEAADTPTLSKCQYSSSPPTASAGDTIAVQCDVNGQVKTTGAGGGGGDASAANQTSQITQATTTNTDLGPPGATACATDTGSCSLNALLQRVAQRITSLITALGSPFQAGGSIGNTTFASTQGTSPWVVAAPTEPCAGSRTFVNGTTAAITDTTSTSIIASAGGSIRNCVSAVIVTNSHATVGTFVKILDGSTIIWEGYAAAAGGGFSSSFAIPLRGTAATAVNCQPVTTGANVICSAAGYTGT